MLAELLTDIDLIHGALIVVPLFCGLATEAMIWFFSSRKAVSNAHGEELARLTTALEQQYFERLRREATEKTVRT
ncbi:hypothetical protein [Blastomonas sp.]|uniref:hypothetical protein n=1 Tax=Blastomonas sp. TaxID=1909299 RepID=UPI0035946430